LTSAIGSLGGNLQRGNSEELAMLGRPSDDEALKLVVAFHCIMEPEKRAELLMLAEKYAKSSPVVEGCTHYLMLDWSLKS
jgi:hypothetical protein